jgi:nitrate reductase cytochrome c-type subunit
LPLNNNNNYILNREKQIPFYNAQNNKIENVAGSVSLSLTHFMDRTGKCISYCHQLKQNSTFKHENGEILNLETSADVHT